MTRKAQDPRLDYALVGGGLQNGLIALALMRWKPAARFAVVESASHLGGNHLWSFHATDLSSRMAEVVEPLVTYRWPAYRVSFPNLERRVDQGYASISSDRFHDVLRSRLIEHPTARLITGATARRVEPDHVLLASGERIEADVVIDARGPGRLQTQGRTAYQKFLGIELQVTRSMTDALPTLMDARVEQTDGYRFVYVLPLDRDRVLVEDTYFSDSPKLDVVRLRPSLVDYANRAGFGVRRILREEKGVLPLPTRWRRARRVGSPYVAGYAGGWFHPTTGYSLPVAARVAEGIATTTADGLPEAWERMTTEHGRQARFSALLNRLLYEAFAPEDRWNVLERFYRLPEPTIARFYAAASTHADRLRILCGRPPRGLSVRLAMTRQQPITTGAPA